MFSCYRPGRVMAIAAFALFVAFAQAAEFERSYGQAASRVVAYASATDAAGNVHVTGFVAGPVSAFGGAALHRVGGWDAFVAKVDASGNTLWARSFGGMGAYAIGRGIVVDGQGNVLVTGVFQGGALTTPAVARIGYLDAFVVKLDAAGNTLWAKGFGGNLASVETRSIAVDGSGGIYLCGGFRDANLTTPSLAKVGTIDALAMKLDTSGNAVWARNFGGAGASAFLTGVAPGSDGGINLAGSFRDAGLAVPALARLGHEDALSMKLDAKGNVSWARNYGASWGVTTLRGIATDVSGNAYLAGGFYPNELTVPPLARIGNVNALAMKVDASGDVVWAKALGGRYANAEATAVAIDGAGGVYLAGTFSASDLGTPALARIGTNDAFVAKLDASGSPTWARNFGGAGAQASAQGVTVDGRGYVSVTGLFANAGLTVPPLTLAGDFDTFVIRRAVGIECLVDQPGDCDQDGIPNAVELMERRDPFTKDNDIFSPGAGAARLFAMQMYRDFLNREGDPAGIQGWADAVAGGSWTRPQVVDAFLQSQEFAGFVAPVVRLYFASFLRVPDYDGLTFNAGLVRAGTVTLTQLADFFAASPEFQATYGTLDNAAFVTLLYNNVLGRAPDPAGLDGWVALLQSGYTRGQVLIGFSDSAEYQAAMANEVFVTMMYAGMLRRTPEPSGFSGWVGFLDAGTYTREQVINGFFLSTEYYHRFLP